MNFTGTNKRPSTEELAALCELYRENGLCVSATARMAERPRSTIRRHLGFAQEADLLGDEEIRDPNVPLAEDVQSALMRKRAAYQRKKQKGDWRKPVMINLPAKPFRLKLFGDPHLDADGCNIDLFMDHMAELSAPGVYGICVGDWFDNWLRALSHLWKETTCDPSDAWLLLKEAMEKNGEGMLAACSGNHDDWTHGPVDPVDELMKRHGVVYRTGAVRIALNFEGCDPLTVSVRHKSRGHSMYSPGHGGIRAARDGWFDHIIVSGHIHQDDVRMYVHPDTQEVAHIHQLSSFKEFDLYPDVQGFVGHRISPVRDLIIDPRLPNTDHSRIVPYFNSGIAAKVHEALQ